MSYQYIEKTGIIVADTSDILDEVGGEFKTAIGQDLIVTPDTPQGVLVTQETQARAAVQNNNAMLANQINPNYSTGVFLDAICAFLGLGRNGATYTLVEGVTISGVAGTPIPSGTLASTEAGNQFETLSAVVIPSGGSVSVNFQAVESGPIPCGIGELRNIEPSTAVIGFESVTNASAGIIGADEQTDISLRQLRNNTLAIQGTSTVEAICSALADVPGVQSFSFLENVAATTQTISGVSLAAHSIWACVQGGSDADIAFALFSNKSLGCGWNGSESVNVVDTISGQTYPVLFDRPSLISIAVIATLSQGSSAADLSVTAVQAMVDFTTGQISGEKGWAVGLNASPFDLGAAIVSENPGCRVRDIQIAIVPGLTYQNTEIDIGLSEQAILNMSYVTVVIE